MKKVLLLIFFALTKCIHFKQDELRTYYSQISSTATSIAMSPSTIISAEGYIVDFAIGTNKGSINFGNLNDYNIQYTSKLTENPIKNLTWTNVGLHIVTGYEIKVVDLSLKNWIILSLSFTDLVYNAVFTYSNETQNILTAISFSNRIEVFQNSTKIYLISLYEPCYAMSFNSIKDELFFVAYNSSSKSSHMYTLFIPSKTFYRTRASSENVETSLAFFSMEGNSHFSISSNKNSLVLWNDYFSKEIPTLRTFSSIKLRSDGSNLIGVVTNNSGAMGVGIVDVLFDEELSIKTEDPQMLDFNTSVIDFDTKREFIIVETESEKIAIISETSQPISLSLQTLITTIARIFALFLIIGIVGLIIFKKTKTAKKQNGAYVQQDFNSQETVSSEIFFPFIFSNRQKEGSDKNEENSKNQSFSMEIKNDNNDY